MRMTRAVRVAVTLTFALAFVPATVSQDQPRYDALRGYARCPRVTGWNGFFRWMSTKRTTCRRAGRFLRAYAQAADRGPRTDATAPARIPMRDPVLEGRGG